jgi:hypothetical protein
VNCSLAHFASIIILSSCISLLYAQPTNIDSLQAARSSQDDNTSAYWVTTVNLAHYYVYHDLQKAEELIESVFDNYVDRGEPFDPCYHKHHLIRSWVNHGNNRLATAIKHLSAAEAIVSKCGSRKEQIEIQVNMASLLVSIKDTTARQYVERYMLSIDTSLNRQEKIAWIMGKNYLGELEEYRGYNKIALQHYLDVMQSGVLDEITQYRLGIVKGIARTAAALGDYGYAQKKLAELISDPSFYNYQHNNIVLAQAENYYKQGNNDEVHSLIQKVKASDNLTALDKLQTCFLRLRMFMKEDRKEEVFKELENMHRQGADIEDNRLTARMNLMAAEVSMKYEPRDKTNQLLENYKVQGGGSQAQDLKSEELWLLNNVVGSQGIRLKNYLSDLKRSRDEKSANELAELMVVHKVEQEKSKSAYLESELVSEQQISAQRSKVIGFSGLSTLLTFLLWLAAYKNAKTQKKLNALLSKDKEQLVEDKKKLVFEKQELISLNESLLAQKNQKPITVTEDTKLEVKTRDKIYFVEVSDIIYVRADNDGTRFFLDGDKTLWTDAALKHFVGELQPRGFARIHRSAAVNLTQIEWINHSTLKMNNGDELKVSRTYKNEILAMVNKD